MSEGVGKVWEWLSTDDKDPDDDRGCDFDAGSFGMFGFNLYMTNALFLRSTIVVI